MNKYECCGIFPAEMEVRVYKKQVSFSEEILKMAQKNADAYFNGNLSAYLSHLVVCARECEMCRRPDGFTKKYSEDVSCSGGARRK